MILQLPEGNDVTTVLR